ncbi:MAG: FHA domain-containing protein, partial [Verrucomicrobiota bacterium]
MPTLVVEWPQGEKTTFPVRGERVTIGRNQGNQIRINDSYVSGYHAEFRRSSEGHYEIVDLGSHNGTAVNGKQVKRTFVKEGDHLIIGLIEGRFLEGNDATKAATPPPRKMEPPRKTGTLDPSLELTQGIRPHHALAEAAQKLQRQVEAKAKADGGAEEKGETNLDVARDELSRVRAEIDEARKEAARLQKEQEETRAQLVQQRKTAAVPLTPAAQKGASGKLEEGRRIASQRDEELARAKEQRSSGVLPFMGGKESGVDREMAKLRSERLALQKENQGMAKRLAIVEGQAKEQERLAKELAATQAELAETKKKVVKESKAELERLQKETKRLESEAADAEKRKQDSTMVVDSEMKKAEGEIQKQKKAFEQE